MDFSEKYIKMCEKAKEIQAEWKLQVGDYYFANKKIHVLGTEIYKNRRIYPFESSPYIKTDFFRDRVWLPRQDQLQEMLNLKVIKYGLLNEIDNILYKVYKDKYISGFAFDSFEQLFLALVMYKKYEKIWDNKKEEWIKEEEE